MTLQETINKMVNIQPLLKNFTTLYASKYTNNLLGAVKTRVQKTGINARGVSFELYSTKPYFIKYTNYPINKAAYTALKKEKKQSLRKAKKILSKESYENIRNRNTNSLYVELPGGYRQARILAGYQVGHKDFTVTNNMWQSVKAFKPIFNGTIITMSYGSNIPFEIKKIEGHNKREGINILEPTKQELEVLQKALVEDLEKLIKEMFNG